jgi:hypothetical protein
MDLVPGTNRVEIGSPDHLTIISNVDIILVNVTQ